MEDGRGPVLTERPMGLDRVSETSSIIHDRSNIRLPVASPRLLSWFEFYLRGYLAKRLHAVRLSKASWSGDLSPAAAGPVVVYLNHPSWWDPLVCVMVCQKLMAGRRHFAAIDAVALQKYKLFERMGFFGVQQNSPRGARDFLRVGSALLSEPDATVWLTAQGQFTDVRQRPVALSPGVGHLAARLCSKHARATLLPVALEYVYWQESKVEALVRIGEPVRLEHHRELNARAWLALLENRLEVTMDALAIEAMSRDEARFETLVQGGSGVGGIYDVWRRIKALATGKRFVAAHAELPAGQRRQ